MKRLALIVIVILFAFQTVAFAEIDLKAISDEDLLALEALIKEEKAIRGMPASAVLTQGTYTIGEGGDIPAGRYIVVLEKGNYKYKPYEYYWTACSVYASEEDQLNRKRADYEDLTTEFNPHPMWSVNLPEGGIFVIERDAIIRLVKTGGIVFE